MCKILKNIKNKTPSSNIQKFCVACNDILIELSSSHDSIDIYHYTSDMAFKSIIENGELRFTNRFYLNDSSEGFYTIELLINNDTEVLKNTYLANHKEEFINKCVEYKDRIKQDEFNVYQLSFSLDNDSLCLWNYYTKGSGIKGYALNFNSDELCKSISENLQCLESGKTPYVLRGKVIYDEQK